jgi:two-component system, NarL family, nitrate/nitrite response regulator NarL
MTPLKVLVVADDPLVRAGLAALLESQPEAEVVGQATGAGLVSAAALYLPEVVLWDWGEGAGGRIEEDMAVVALVSGAAGARAALAAGARGLLSREVNVDALVAALQAAFRGLIALEPRFAASLRQRQASAVARLTPRELEVLQLLASGLANKAIARRLEVSEHTVKFHVAAILSKLNARSRTEAVGQAIRLGLILL